jgi:hypothetical protein
MLSAVAQIVDRAPNQKQHDSEGTSLSVKVVVRDPRSTFEVFI